MLLFIIRRLWLCSTEVEMSVIREQRGTDALKCPTEKKKRRRRSGISVMMLGKVACSHPLRLTANIKLSNGLKKRTQTFLHSEERSKDDW